MPNLLTIPNEILDEIVSNLDALATSHLLLSCRSLASLLTPAMHLHAVAQKNNEPALHWASREGHLPLIKFLLTRFPVDLQKDDRSTPLQVAAWECTNTLVVEYLLLHGADVNHTNCFGLTALYYACWDESAWACRGESAREAIAEPMVRLLIAHGANVNSDSDPPIIVAVDAGFTRVTRLLLVAGANPNVRSVDGEPVVVSAARERYPVGMLELLLDHGADINAVNSFNINAMMMAVKYAPVGTVQMLVNRGVNLNCVDRNGSTALMLAFIYGRPDITKYLLGMDGVDVNGWNLGGVPLEWARSLGYDIFMRIIYSR